MHSKYDRFVLPLAVIALAFSITSILLTSLKSTANVEIIRSHTNEAMVNTTQELKAILNQISLNQGKRVLKDFVARNSSHKNHFAPATLHVLVKLESKTSISQFEEKDQHLTLIFHYTEHNRGFQTTPEEITIVYSGIYYLYGNIVIQNKITSNSQEGSSIFAFIYRVSPNNPATSGVLLRSVSTYKDFTNFAESSFIGGIFHLQEGDIIKTCLSTRSASFTLDESASFIGIFMLSSN